jgi:flagellar P-ring protein precursor FlgI
MKNTRPQFAITLLVALLPLLAAAQPPPAQNNGQPQTLGQGQMRPQTFVENLDPSVRIKDITFVQGDRVNHVSGDGLVFGLSGTGGQSEQTQTMAGNFYLRRGIQINRVETQNISAVLVSGKIPAYARKGETILVNVSVADDATSLRGGTLNQTALRGIDDQIYAIAQGPIIGGGVSAQGDAGSVTKNHPTVGVCEAIIEREIGCNDVVVDGQIRLVLRNKSYSTATQIANELNGLFPHHATALDSGTLNIFVPRTFRSDIPAFISTIGDLRVRPDQPARVVINQKTGTIVMGHSVKISRVLFASENIVIATSESPIASQPNPLSQGQTAVLPRSSIDIVESGGTYNVWREGLTVGDLATALNTLAVSPNTLISIFTSLRNQGALQAELVIE